MTEEAGQNHTLFMKDQQLYRIPQQVTWWRSDEWKNCVPILGSMHPFLSIFWVVNSSKSQD